MAQSKSVWELTLVAHTTSAASFTTITTTVVDSSAAPITPIITAISGCAPSARALERVGTSTPTNSEGDSDSVITDTPTNC